MGGMLKFKQLAESKSDKDTRIMIITIVSSSLLKRSTDIIGLGYLEAIPSSN